MLGLRSSSSECGLKCLHRDHQHVPGSRCVPFPVRPGSAVFSEVLLRRNASQGLKFGGTGREIHPSPPFGLLLLLASCLSCNQERKPGGGLAGTGVHVSPSCLACMEALWSKRVLRCHCLGKGLLSQVCCRVMSATHCVPMQPRPSPCEQDEGLKWRRGQYQHCSSREPRRFLC